MPLEGASWALMAFPSAMQHTNRRRMHRRRFDRRQAADRRHEWRRGGKVLEGVRWALVALHPAIQHADRCRMHRRKIRPQTDAGKRLTSALLLMMRRTR